MKLLYLSKDKVLGSFLTALIADNLSSNLNLEKIVFSENNHFIKILNNIFNLNSIFEDKSSIEQRRFMIAQRHFMIELFPLIIYSYENTETLAIIEQLKKQDKSIEVLIIIVNLILRDQLNFDDPLPQIIDHLENLSLINSLNKLDQILKTKETFTIINETFKTDFELENKEIYQALYIFLSNPYDIENSLQRSQYFSQQTQETMILSGYLLGLYHGYHNLPYKWHNILKINPENNEIETLTEKLVAHWQGKMDNK